MMRDPTRRRLMAGLCALTACAVAGPAAAQTKPRARKTSMTAHDFTFPAIDGGELPLKAWAGKAVLVVNTASFCGFTPQYRELEAVWRRYRDRGFVVLGVPSNDFGAQEPGSETEIAKFCESRYGVGFPMTAKQAVIGPDAHPLYRWIAAELGEGAAPRWNFHKYLLARDHSIAGTWSSRVSPDDPELLAAIEAALAA